MQMSEMTKKNCFFFHFRMQLILFKDNTNGRNDKENFLVDEFIG